MAQPFLGQIIAVGFNFAPVGWQLCQGQLLPIADNTSLFNLIGTTYGGDGASTFALPNLCGRVAIDQGQAPTLSNYVLGQLGGSETVTLSVNEIGGHSHPLMASAKVGTTDTPDGAMALAQNAQILVNMYASATPSVSLAPASVTSVGSGQPHENRQPYLTINYIIAVNGIYPQQG